jgi:hypothetical protein
MSNIELQDLSPKETRERIGGIVLQLMSVDRIGVLVRVGDGIIILNARQLLRGVDPVQVAEQLVGKTSDQDIGLLLADIYDQETL